MTMFVNAAKKLFVCMLNLFKTFFFNESTILPQYGSLISNDKELNEIETKIDYRRQLVDELSKLREENLQITINNTLKKLFSDELLRAYSYYGQQMNPHTGLKNKKFQTLKINSVIKDVCGPNIMEDDITECIRVYLSGLKSPSRTGTPRKPKNPSRTSTPQKEKKHSI